MRRLLFCSILVLFYPFHPGAVARLCLVRSPFSMSSCPPCSSFYHLRNCPVQDEFPCCMRYLIVSLYWIVAHLFSIKYSLFYRHSPPISQLALLMMFMAMNLFTIFILMSFFWPFLVIIFIKLILNLYLGLGFSYFWVTCQSKD